MAQDSTLHHFISALINTPLVYLYQLIQSLISRLVSPDPPPPNAQLGRPKIAIIGAGLTGVSSAAHCVGHGFDVTIFEAGDRNSLGGIWAKVNNTSGLQIHVSRLRMFYFKSMLKPQSSLSCIASFLRFNGQEDSKSTRHTCATHDDGDLRG